MFDMLQGNGQLSQMVENYSQHRVWTNNANRQLHWLDTDGTYTEVTECGVETSR